MLPVIAIVAWYFLKVFQFQASPEQYADGMVVLQLSRGWLEGRPLLFDTIYGDHALQHNYYFILLVGFLTKSMGVYGLFVAYLGLLGLFFWNWRRSFARFGDFEGTTTWLTAFFFAFGPMAYFIYLDYFGWHPEQYFVPLLALISLSLAERKRGMLVLWLLLTFLVKESSVVLIYSLLLFCSVIDLILTTPGKHWSGYILNMRNLILTGVCMLLFFLGLWWLSHLNGPKPSRLYQALSHTQVTVTLFLYILFSCLVGLLVFGIGLLPFIPWLRGCPHNRLILSMLGGCYTILFIVFATEALFYFPIIYPGVSYPARIGGLWGFMFSSFIFLSYRLTSHGAVPNQKAVTWILAGCLLQFLFSPFLVAHHFTFESKPSILSANISYMLKTRLGLDPYPDGISRELYALAKKMPAGSEVVVPFKYTRYFENVYPSFWNANGRPPLNILEKPLLYVYEKELVNNGVYHNFPGKNYKIIPNENFLILADSSWYNTQFK